MRISDWSSDVCSSDLQLDAAAQALFQSEPRVSPLWSFRRISEGQDRRKACNALRERSPDGMRSAMAGPGVTPALTALAVSVGAAAGGVTGTGGDRKRVV